MAPRDAFGMRLSLEAPSSARHTRLRQALERSKQLNITVEAYSPVGRSGHSGDIRTLPLQMDAS